jgi:hypothetical protein
VSARACSPSGRLALRCLPSRNDRARKRVCLTRSSGRLLPLSRLPVVRPLLWAICSLLPRSKAALCRSMISIVGSQPYRR